MCFSHWAWNLLKISRHIEKNNYIRVELMVVKTATFLTQKTHHKKGFGHFPFFSSPIYYLPTLFYATRGPSPLFATSWLSLKLISSHGKLSQDKSLQSLGYIITASPSCGGSFLKILWCESTELNTFHGVRATPKHSLIWEVFFSVASWILKLGIFVNSAA